MFRLLCLEIALPGERCLHRNWTPVWPGYCWRGSLAELGRRFSRSVSSQRNSTVSQLMVQRKQRVPRHVPPCSPALHSTPPHTFKKLSKDMKVDYCTCNFWCVYDGFGVTVLILSFWSIFPEGLPLRPHDLGGLSWERIFCVNTSVVMCCSEGASGQLSEACMWFARLGGRLPWVDDIPGC